MLVGSGSSSVCSEMSAARERRFVYIGSVGKSGGRKASSAVTQLGSVTRTPDFNVELCLR